MESYRNMTVRKFLSVFFVCCCCISVNALIPSDKKIRLTEKWQFIRQDMGSVWEVMRPSKPGNPESVPLWQTVTLPHCFNAEDAVDPDDNYYQGPGWYRTLLDIDSPYEGGRMFLEFEGAGQKSEVYVYTTLVARHTGGYDEWKVDITEAVAKFQETEVCKVRFHGKIPVAVRCDNSRDTDMIPSNMSDFNVYGGLYRYVNLVYVPDTYIKRIKIDAGVDKKGEKGNLSIDVKYGSSGRKTATFSARIFAPDGKEVLTIPAKPLLPEVDGTVVCLMDEAVRRPVLWSTSSPQLYTCRLEMVCGVDTLHAEERFGFRHFLFQEKGPFYLNGKRLLLRGTHRHEDHAGVGAAMTEDMMRKEMKLIKDMGANFIRLGHYQQSDIILRLCDELGILVWEEIPWCRGGLGGVTYRKQAHDMLEAMITQHYNHPSVILWGLGNENDWPGDFETFSKDTIRAFMSELNEQAHRLDKGRSTCIRRCDFCKDIVDVYSPSIWKGWYSGNFREYFDAAKEAWENNGRFLHAEWGGDSHAGRHAEGTFGNMVSAAKNGDWSESYIIRLFDWHLKEQECMPWLAGSLCWTFKDFSTPLRPDNPIPYVNQKGVVERDGTPKESYYVFQSYWSDNPMIHIYGHSWPVRWGRQGEEKEILVYSNCSEVELFVNGISCGRKKRNVENYPAAGFHWNVTLNEGMNRIEAKGVKGELEIQDKIVQRYETRVWGKLAQLSLSQTDADAEMVCIEVELTDANGVRCLDARDFVEFFCTEKEALIINQGTVKGSKRVQLTNGTASVLVRKRDFPVVVGVCDWKHTLSPVFMTID